MVRVATKWSRSFLTISKYLLMYVFCIVCVAVNSRVIAIVIHYKYTIHIEMKRMKRLLMKTHTYKYRRRKKKRQWTHIKSHSSESHTFIANRQNSTKILHSNNSNFNSEEKNQNKKNVFRFVEFFCSVWLFIAQVDLELTAKNENQLSDVNVTMRVPVISKFE